MSDIVKLYNPASAASLTPEQIDGLQKLTSEQIKELALAYPNISMNRAYLLIIDGSKDVNKQIPALSSFENLRNLREKNGLKTYVAYSFRGVYKPRVVATSKPKRSEVLDLSDAELMNLPGFKAAQERIEGQKVAVVKVGAEENAEPETVGKVSKPAKTTKTKSK